MIGSNGQHNSESLNNDVAGTCSDQAIAPKVKNGVNQRNLW
ncbi:MULTISPECIES: hypothetical protein [Oscillatoriales]|uniref:Uncharacterized protein n=2 Tax=Limnospira TaxID=2596745 RepID=A0A9P1KM91_9CYAN|nr:MULTISPECIES: hypothetical protein [Oscillatoriales]EKD09742.1 hypothetical protein SPLC1_S160250 [Arthrospira platensis C1]MDT9181145.1 hypothetical protein [Limnospira sp. PMC 289.06]MDT9189903.1 hypothetical protein [Limnospira sp. PMC 894.15]MDT9250065.1 hypothetical protein [Limnospira sp. PMC 1280.21]MDT9294847.1 hypothetical protein [Arthrospira platensis PCC 7345]WAK74151.1 hypothetical protein AP9108_32535 [Arthrospira sp. PCC 9108]